MRWAAEKCLIVKMALLNFSFRSPSRTLILEAAPTKTLMLVYTLEMARVLRVSANRAVLPDMYPRLSKRAL